MFADAISHFERALELESTPRAQGNLGNAHLARGRVQAALAEMALDDLEALGPYGLPDVPRKKLAQRRQWWSRGEESLSPDIGPAMAALGLT